MPLKNLLNLVFVLTAIHCCAQSIDPFPPSPVPDRIILTWSDDPATTQSVNWRTNTLVGKSWAEIAVADPSPDFRSNTDTVWAKTTFFASDNNAAHYHSVTFDSLTPNQMYIYRVGNGEYFSEWFQFKTANNEPAPFTFLYFGDAQNDIKSLWSRCIRQAFMTRPDVDFLLHAGDLINRANADAEWGEWFYAGGWIYGVKPSVATPGNHEYYRSLNQSRQLSKNWKPTFTLPENGPEGLEETVYYIDYQDARIISLDSQGALSDPEKMEKQRVWLEGILENNPNKWTIVTQHHPIYSTALGRNNESLREAFQPLFEQYGVDLVLQGHDHTYGRGHNASLGAGTQNLGPTYVVSVSGPKMYGLGFDDWMEWGASNTQLYQLIRVNGDILLYEAYTVLGELYDVFKLEKQPDGVSHFMDLTSPSMKERLDVPQRQLRRMSEEEIQKYRAKLEDYKASKR